MEDFHNIRGDQVDDIDVLMESHYEPQFQGTHRGAKSNSTTPEKTRKNGGINEIMMANETKTHELDVPSIWKVVKN